MPSTVPANPNLRRRLLPGLLAVTITPVLRPLLRLARPRDGGKSGKGSQAPLWVFSSYMVGDLFMALPALKKLAAATDLRLLCRPDCVKLVEREGLKAIPFDNAFFTRRTPVAFFRTLRAAWRLRSLPKGAALDLDADPRTALWLALAGCARIESYRRPYGALFDATFPLSASAVHQADRDQAVADAFLSLHGGELPLPKSVAHASTPGIDTSAPASILSSSSPWILSVWTRKAAKNWPLEYWNTLMEELKEQGVPFAVLHAPDGDSAYQLFRARWAGRVAFVEGPLGEIAEEVRRSAGVIATDNFLGHMAGYYGKPVLWINRVSPAEQVEPRGPHTVRVGNGGPGKPETPSVKTVTEAFGTLLKS